MIVMSSSSLVKHEIYSTFLLDEIIKRPRKSIKIFKASWIVKHANNISNQYLMNVNYKTFITQMW